jgi:hypothetical protein
MMTFEEWVKRLEDIIGEPAKSFSIKGKEYVCTFRGRGQRKVKADELKDDYPFYSLSHFYYHQTYTQIFVNKNDFIQIIWNRKGKDIWEVKFNHNLFSCSKNDFSEVSLKHKKVLDWVYDYYVLNAKNSSEIIPRY